MGQMRCLETLFPVSVTMLRRLPDKSGPSPWTGNQPPLSSSSMRFSHISTSSGDIYGMQNISDVDKSRIYYEWIGSGKPHNLVCSQCRKPDNLVLCETCCRSYHSTCLTATEASIRNGQFYCPSCRQNQWDQAPPQFDNAMQSSNVSRSSTPSARSSVKLASPLKADRLSTQLGPTAQGIQSPTAQAAPSIECRQHQNDISAPPQYDLVGRAKSFLFEYGQFPLDHEFRLDLLLKLGSMIAEVESHRFIQQELQQLRDENANLRSSNASLRGIVSNPSSNPPPSYLPPVLPSPAGTIREKSWDRIVTDLI
ncbi:hypothetical protein BDV59DRAFT_173769 [Aspergillus ambiguus]|uniref:PHD finger protein n=1 Tax=Aspergillus ambiguus TaxID=176160 RepID=UPI003CCE44E1